MRKYINDNWVFTEEFTEELIHEMGPASQMEAIRLPHTCKETPYHYFDEQIYQMVCGYQKVIRAEEEWQGKVVLITFDGVGHDSIVYLNGEEIGRHHCGYTAFTMDISAKLKYGAENLLTVRVDSREELNVPPFGFVIDYMTFGGIYRDVYLDIKEPVYFTELFTKSNIISFKEHTADLITQVSVNREELGLFVRQSIKNKRSGEWDALGECSIGNGTLTLCYRVLDVEFWDTEHPVLYEIKTELIGGGVVLETCMNRFGFRKAEFKEDGFYLNGKKLKLRGLNRHQSYPYVGYAMPESMQKLDADILKKELGVNAVRTSHYPQSHYFLDRCDELGLLVFTEIPGWQHIGDAAWKDQAVENVKDMVLQYRNHTSIILWGVRINESADDDEFYLRTNEMAHKLDDSRPTGGVRAHKKSSLLEDVYTYNDFVHDGKTKGCEKKSAVTSDVKKPYLISEYNGHMYPTKAFDCEDHRVEHALRHVRVLDAVAGEEDIAGSFGWCMFDYNTHKDFGSGDRICYHGVMDMFRNPKLAAAAYASQQENSPVLELSSSMDIGEHPACNRGETYIFTNAPHVRMYKNDRFIKEYTRDDSPYKNLLHGPIVIDDYLGDVLSQENFPKKKEEGIKQILNDYARYGMSGMPISTWLKAAWMIIRYRMKVADVVPLYTKYVGDWGGTATTYRFEAVDTNGSTIHKTIWKKPMTEVVLHAEVDHTALVEKNSYDVAAIRILARDEYDNVLPVYNEPLCFEVSGPIELIGPSVISFNGGMSGTYIKTKGESGEGKLIIRSGNAKEVVIEFDIEV
ncbi:MAG: glycoside hydrolase family 2 protein [Roseburia sp.]|nr:glycoside hydrolase family 2 protein [Roseburia sp.]